MDKKIKLVYTGAFISILLMITSLSFFSFYVVYAQETSINNSFLPTSNEFGEIKYGVRFIEYPQEDGSILRYEKVGPINVYEDDGWKRKEDAKSLKDKEGFSFFPIEQDGTHLINVIDFNYTYLELELSYNKSNLGEYEYEIEEGKMKTKFKVLEWKFNETINESYLDEIEYEIEIEEGNSTNFVYYGTLSGKVFQFGDNSTYWQYQETADAISTTGWGAPLNIYDGSWSTYTYATPMDDNFGYFNYTKPSGSTISSQWQVKDGAHVTPPYIYTTNLTLISNCWNQNPLQLRIYVMWGIPVACYGQWQCWNGTSWHTLRIQHMCAQEYAFRCYEEAMWWNIEHCEQNNDCAAGEYCKTDQTCGSDLANGATCDGVTYNSTQSEEDGACTSGYCDSDGVGLADDDHCFTPYNTYFDGQENTYCEYSTDQGTSIADERIVGTDLNDCNGVGEVYYEDEISPTCGLVDITSVFECTDTDCSCDDNECDEIAQQGTINYCDKGEQTYFQDDCGTTATAEDHDNICRKSGALGAGDGCTADADCDGITAGTGDCNASCAYVPDITSPTFITIPANTTINYTQGFGVSFNATDETEFDSYAINWTTLFQINQTGYLENSTTNIPVGIYLINVTINDTENNLNSTIYKVTVNQISSSINLTLDGVQGNNSINEDTSIDLNCSTITGDSGAYLVLYNNGTLINNGTSPIGNTTLFSDPGDYNITCIYENTQNYTTSSETWWLEVNDTTAPTIIIDHPKAQPYNYNTSLSLNYTVIDTGVGVDSCWFNVINSTGGLEIDNTTITSCLNTTFNLSKDDNYTLTLYSNDTMGNVNSTTIIFLIDTIYPQINLIYPTNTSYTIIQTELNFSYSDINVNSCWYSIDGGTTNITHASCTNLTGLNSGQGTIIWLVGINDTAGNENYSIVTFSVKVPLDAPFDEQVIISCGGDEELVIGCLGDEELFFIGTKAPVLIPAGGSGIRLLKKIHWLLIIIIITLSLLFCFLLLYYSKRKEKREERPESSQGKFYKPSLISEY